MHVHRLVPHAVALSSEKLLPDLPLCAGRQLGFSPCTQYHRALSDFYKAAKMNVMLSVLPQRELGAEARAALVAMILEAGEVNPDTLSALIDRAIGFVFARIDGALVGVGAIKRPYDSHRRDVFSWAKCGLDPTEFPFELGWIYVKPEAQGNRIASQLVEKLMPLTNGERVYATSRVNNHRMHSSLKRFGFNAVGTPYDSRQNQPKIQLFVRFEN
jgi:GNAT superfamily N-acetyltransferase